MCGLPKRRLPCFVTNTFPRLACPILRKVSATSVKLSPFSFVLVALVAVAANTLPLSRYCAVGLLSLPISFILLAVLRSMSVTFAPVFPLKFNCTL